MSTAINLESDSDKLNIALRECAREPIHIPDSIQPMGFLLHYDNAADRVTAISRNLQEHLGVEASELLNQPLSTVLGKEESLKLRNQLKIKPDQQTLLGYKKLFRLRMHTWGKEDFVVFVHESGDQLIIEFELYDYESNFSFFDFTANIEESLYWMFAPNNPSRSIYQMCIEEVRDITGFDRVMLYRFDEQYNGQVIAEDRGEIESFLGLHFPASDIPAQARNLYTKNWIRIIPDVNYGPVPLVRRKGDQQQPIDLSRANFRSVSPVHIQYLRNMGVSASMSVSIIVDGHLWGLIACHHKSPIKLSADRRAAAKYLGQLLSLYISRHEKDEIKERNTLLKSLENQILSELFGDLSQFYPILAKKVNDVMALCNANALMLIHEGKIRVLENLTVNRENIDTFVTWLEKKTGNNLYYQTEQLPPDEAISNFIAPPYPGLLTMPLLGSPRSFIVWFRKERINEVNWGGKPQKEVVRTASGKYRLNPRKSFESWTEMVKGQSSHWSEVDIEMCLSFSKSLAILQIRHLDNMYQQNEELQVAQAQNEYKLKEISRKEKILNLQLRTVIESSPDALAAIDNENRFFMLNKNYQKLFESQYGLTPKVGDNYSELTGSTSEKHKISLKFWEEIRQQRSKTIETTYEDISGRTVHEVSTYNPIYDHRKKLRGTLVTIRDVTQAKENEIEIKTLYQKYALIINTLAPINWSTSPEGAFVEPQATWAAYTGQDYSEHQGEGWLIAVHEEDREKLKEHWGYCLENKVKYEFSCRIWNATTQKYHHFLIYGIPILDEQEEVSEWFGFCIDIQPLKEQEEKLEAALRALQLSNADLQNFAYVASHDLQEPLRMITSYLDLIERRYQDKLDDKGRTFIYYAVDGAQRMRSLIQDLLTYSKVNKSASYEPVPLDKLFGQVQKNHQLTIEEKGAIIHADPLPEVMAIPVQMLQLFTNLLGNSLKFARNEVSPEIRVSVEERKLSWQFTFEDNGIGIDPKYANKVFNIFFRLQSKQKYPGTGMGLAISQRVVTNHGGKIWIDENYQQGTRFFFTIRKFLGNDNNQ